MSDLKHCYEILEIGPESTYEEARMAFRDMVSIWHPDKFIHNPRLKEKAEEKIKLINAAWDELQANFHRKRDNAVELSGKELVVSAATRPSRECKHQQRGGKASRAGCYITDLDFEPLVDVEQARKAYRHRFHSCGPDPGCFEAATGEEDCDPGAGGAECVFSRQDAGGTEPPGNGLERKEARRRPEGDAAGNTGNRTPDSGGEHFKGNKGAARGHRGTQHFPDDSLNESGRKVKLLTDSYWLGFLERKFVNWQQREREHRKQRDADKEIARKNKILSDRYLSGFKTWLAKEKAKYRPSPMIGGLFRRNASPGGEVSSGKFLFGVPDITLTYVKGGPFLAGNEPRGGHHYRVVTVDDFYIGRHPVTVRQWSKAMGVETAGAEADLPIFLTWEGAHEFISRLNEITGLKFRVPTEAEWQYAARCEGQSESRHEAVNAAAVRRHFSPAGPGIGQHKQIAPVHVDMSGNGGEWVTGALPEKSLLKVQQAARWGAGNSGQRPRGAVQRDLQGNIQVFHTLPKSPKASDKGIRFSFRLAHAAF